MTFNILYFILAALGLSFLVFIHELGHYIVAKRVGMRVEVFSIGFGKPIYVWYRGKVKWQVCWMLFGGYVRIAGMEKEGDKEPFEVADGFYGKKPLDRIKVALMGPIVNIVFAFLIFTVIWVFGGRYKSYDEFTNVIGWVDPKSELHKQGVRPGDTIVEYNNQPFAGFKDLIYHAIVQSNVVSISGDKIDYFAQKNTPYSYQLKPYNDPRLPDADFQTIGVLCPAGTLLYDKFLNGSQNPIPSDSPFFNSGLSYGDRIVWVDGHLIFSLAQLVNLVNTPTTLLTVERDSRKILLNIARVELGDLDLTNEQKDEFDDWRHEIGLQTPIRNLVYIPYFINSKLVVETEVPFIDDDLVHQEEALLANKLQKGDKIIAVDGIPVSKSYDFLSHIQVKKVQVIVANEAKRQIVSWNGRDNIFTQDIHWQDLALMINDVGSVDAKMAIGNLKRLSPIEPIAVVGQNGSFNKKLGAKVLKKKIQMKKTGLLPPRYNLFGSLAMQDQFVIYNPTPLKVFQDVCGETYRTLTALLSGHLSPKWMSGPVGIVKVMHDGWSLGVKEALFWIGVISLNLGLMNLLPIPVLDGGHICFSLYEAFTKRPIRSKTMEKVILPFVVLLVIFFIYVTLQDVLRLIN
jgi:regulator of sigma E protease